MKRNVTLFSRVVALVLIALYAIQISAQNPIKVGRGSYAEFPPLIHAMEDEHYNDEYCKLYVKEGEYIMEQEKLIKEAAIDISIQKIALMINEKMQEYEQTKDNNVKLSFPEMKYCTDNAAMIGAAAYYAYKSGIRGNLELNAKAIDSLYKGTETN